MVKCVFADNQSHSPISIPTEIEAVPIRSIPEYDCLKKVLCNTIMLSLLPTQAICPLHWQNGFLVHHPREEAFTAGWNR